MGATIDVRFKCDEPYCGTQEIATCSITRDGHVDIVDREDARGWTIEHRHGEQRLTCPACVDKAEKAYVEHRKAKVER